MFLLLDVDECLDGTDDCDAKATCGNVPGTYTCDCIEGYAGTGQQCAGNNAVYFMIIYYIYNFTSLQC